MAAPADSSPLAAVPARKAAPRPARGGRLALLLAGVLALHGWLLGELTAALPRPAASIAAAARLTDAAPRASAVLLRVAPQQAEPVAAPAAQPQRATAPTTTHTPPTSRAIQAAATPPPPLQAPAERAVLATKSAMAPPTAVTAPAPAGPHDEAPGVETTTPDTAVATLTALAVAAPRRPAATAPLPSPPAGSPPLPTTPPPSAELIYAVHRGPVAGKGRLVWQVNPASSGALAGYSLTLEARMPVLGVIFSESSSGGFDAHGLAPTRHTERRLRRSERALSMTRDAGGGVGSGNGVLSLSASTARLALQPGTQDRVSWLVQLAAVYGAAPLAATQPGSANARPTGLPTLLNLPVASVNGDLRLWQFRLLPPAPDAAGLLHLERRPAPGDFDTTAEVWLDPARRAWPVRVLLTEVGGDTLELLLERLNE